MNDKKRQTIECMRVDSGLRAAKACIQGAVGIYNEAGLPLPTSIVLRDAEKVVERMANPEDLALCTGRVVVGENLEVSVECDAAVCMRLPCPPLDEQR